MAPQVVYHSVEDILAYLDDKGENGVKDLLEIYNNTKDKYGKTQCSNEDRKYPLIVLEGLDGSGKSSVGKRLAKKLNSELWRTPPESISHLRPQFDNYPPPLRTAFYCLGNYIAGMEVAMLQKKSTVIMDRYWHSTCAFALAQAVQDNPSEYSSLPPQGDEIYRWPLDLLKPDLVLLLDVSEETRMARHSKRNTTNTNQEQLLASSLKFRTDVIKAYKSMVDPGVEIVNANAFFNKLLPQLLDKIHSTLSI